MSIPNWRHYGLAMVLVASGCRQQPPITPSLSPKKTVEALVNAYQNVDDKLACSYVLGCKPSELDPAYLAYRDKNRRGWIGVSKLSESLSGRSATVSYEIAIGDHPNVPLLGGPETVNLILEGGAWKVIPPSVEPKESDKPHLLNYLTYMLTHPEFQRKQAK